MPIRWIRLLSLWGNDDAEGAISMSYREWNHVCRGGELDRRIWGWYEGSRFPIDCWFHDRQARLRGRDGADYWSGTIQEMNPYDRATKSRLVVPDRRSVPPDPPKPTQVFVKDTMRKKHQPKALAALQRIATPAAQSAATTDAAQAQQTFTVDGATATLTPNKGRRAPTLRIESLPLRVRMLREIGCFEDEVVDYERKQTLRNEAK